MEFKLKMAKPNVRIYLPELFSEVCKLKTKEEKIELLKSYRTRNSECNNLIRDFVQCVYHPQVILDLPPDSPPYKNDWKDYTLAPSTLLNAFKRIPYFVKGHSKYIPNQIKRETLFIQTLESMYIEDSKLLIMVKDKKIDGRKYKGLTEDLLREAFPDFLPEKEGSKKS